MAALSPAPEGSSDSIISEEDTDNKNRADVHVLAREIENEQEVKILKRPNHESKDVDNGNGHGGEDEELPTTSCTGTSDDERNAQEATMKSTGCTLPIKPPDSKATTNSPRRARFRAYIRSALAIDYTLIALVPGMRTAFIIVMDWIIFGIGNANSTAFVLGALYVGLADSNGSWALRLQTMGVTLISVVLFGALLPALAYGSVPGTLCAAFGVAFFAGLSSFLEHPSVYFSFKLGTALFAIHISSYQAAYEGTAGILLTAVVWTLIGGSCSLLAAVLPELLMDNREAIHTDLFQVWHGFGSTVKQWRAHWDTLDHVAFVPMPSVIMSISRTTDRIEQDATLDATAKQWLLKVMEHADTIRIASLCLSNGYRWVALRHEWHARGSAVSSQHQQHEVIDNLFLALGRTLGDIGYAFQFPFMIRCFPCIRQRITRRAERFYEAAASLLSNTLESDNGVEVLHGITWKWLPALVKVLQEEVQGSVQMALNVKQWPPNSSLCSLSQRICAAIPSELPRMNKEPVVVIIGYAFRFAVAFSLAFIPGVFMETGTSEHWFPMTVALIMGPASAATYERVVQRTIGTLFGIGLGSLISPLFRFPSLLITLLGLNSYGAVVFLQPNYTLFTLFITSFVFCLTVGTGVSLWIVVLYRCLWTLAAAALVLAMSYTYPPRTELHLTAKLAAFARSILVFARTVVEEYSSLLRYNDYDSINTATAGDSQSLVWELANQQMQIARKDATEKRRELLTCLHDAFLSPTAGYRIDPHFVAPQVAAALVTAAVTPLFLALTKDKTYSDLLSDLGDLQELERLVQRLEKLAASPPGRPKMSPQVSCEPIFETEGGPFTHTIATAHWRLDEAGLPKGSSSSCTDDNA
jgi:Fusaric acid resistance protein-like